MSLYIGIITAMALLNVPLQLLWYWKVFHMWPVSWSWMIIMAVTAYLQAELAKYCIRRIK